MIKKRDTYLLSAILLFSMPSNAQRTTDMLNDTTHLDEVVVVGYGTQTRKQLTKSVSSIGKADIERLAPTAMSIQDILSSYRSDPPRDSACCRHVVVKGRKSSGRLFW